MFRRITIFTLMGFILLSCAVIPGSEISLDNTSGYQMISVTDLQGLIKTEDITLVNVHIPIEGNIPETDVEIPFNDIENYLDLLPENKDEQIILYCRSGSMSRTASFTLIELGYTNVLDLEGGYDAWVAAGLPFTE